jgi:hypothetical protein
VVDKRYKMVMSGQIPLSPDAMAAVLDWEFLAPIMTGDRWAGIPACQWMVDNADKAGWSKLKDRLQRKLENEKQGIGYGISIDVAVTPEGMDIVNSPEDRLKYALMVAKYARRLPSFAGPKEYRTFTRRLWDFEGTVHEVRSYMDNRGRSGSAPR